MQLVVKGFAAFERQFKDARVEFVKQSIEHEIALEEQRVKQTQHM